MLSSDVGDENMAFVEFDVKSSSYWSLKKSGKLRRKLRDLERVLRRDDVVAYSKVRKLGEKRDVYFQNLNNNLKVNTRVII